MIRPNPTVAAMNPYALPDISGIEADGYLFTGRN
jgi:hypothetical protein